MKPYNPTDLVEFENCITFIRTWMESHDKDRMNYEESVKYLNDNIEELRKVG
jgi:hypothetical protein